MNTTPSPRARSWPITLGATLLSMVFTWLAVGAWLISYDGSVPFEPVVRLITSLIFLTIACLQLRVALRGYTKLTIRDLLRDLLAGGL